MTKRLTMYTILGLLWAGAYCLALQPLTKDAAANAGSISSLAILFTVALTSLEAACMRGESPAATRGNLRLYYSLVSIIVSTIATAIWALAWQRNLLLFAIIEGGSAVLFAITAIVTHRNRIKDVTKHKLFQ